MDMVWVKIHIGGKPDVLTTILGNEGCNHAVTCGNILHCLRMTGIPAVSAQVDMGNGKDMPSGKWSKPVR